MEIKLRIPALEKLLDYSASGIGSVAGPMVASWKARREAEAKLITAKGDAEAQEVTTEGQARSMQIIAAAQADARTKLLSSDSTVRGEIDLAETVAQRIEFQEEKRQSNISTVVETAAHELGDKEVQDHEVDHDWTARFFNDVQDISSEEMQKLWAKVLAREVVRPGSTSMKTLELMRNLDRAAASLFSKLCSLSIYLGVGRDDEFFDIRVSSLGGDAGHNALKSYGVSFGELNLLNEFGLIISDFNSWRDIRSAIGIGQTGNQEHLHIPFRFQNRYWILVPTEAGIRGKEFRLSGVALTRSGRELSKVVELQPESEYAQDLMAYFERQKLKMAEVKSWNPRVIKGIAT